VLRVREVSVHFQTAEGSFAALDRISFDLERSGSLALVGESGSGKTTVALSLLDLLPPGAVRSGRIEICGETRLAALRGRRIAMVFHDPLSALNPVMRIRKQIAEAAPAGAVLPLLRSVGLRDEVADAWPHQLSGGMRQRVLIAMAIAAGPSILVADEPTSALDSVSQAGIVELLRRLRRERGIGLLLATHDLSLARRLCDTIAVMYAGRIVERARSADLLERPLHPYTAGLLRSIPPMPDQRRARLEPVRGSPPSPWALPSGCRFRDRCPVARPDCAGAEPSLAEHAIGREAACRHPEVA